jgi:hypothetical protein
VKILTANDLRSGAVVWWDGQGWSLHVDAAVDVSDEGEAIAARERAAQAVVDTSVIAATVNAGAVRPAHIKDRIRALGPTVRLDLSLNPSDPTAADRVI